MEPDRLRELRGTPPVPTTAPKAFGKSHSNPIPLEVS